MTTSALHRKYPLRTDGCFACWPTCVEIAGERHEREEHHAAMPPPVHSRVVRHLQGQPFLFAHSRGRMDLPEAETLPNTVGRSRSSRFGVSKLLCRVINEGGDVHWTSERLLSAHLAVVTAPYRPPSLPSCCPPLIVICCPTPRPCTGQTPSLPLAGVLQRR